MANKHTGLGKGFDVLIPQGVTAVLTEVEGERVQNLFISAIFPNSDQPRHDFDQTALNELSDSIKEHGVLQPIIVTPAEDGKFQIIAGERRWRASKIAGLSKIPAIVRTAKELEKLEMAIIENIQRVDLNPLEQAASLAKLHDTFNQGWDIIARKLGKAESTISNIVRLLTLPPAAQDALQKKKITEGHARAILALKDDPEKQEQLLLLIQRNGWTVRQAEQFVVATTSGAKDTTQAAKSTKPTNTDTVALTRQLKRAVTIKRLAKGGQLQIRFKSDEDLQALIDLISSLNK